MATASIPLAGWADAALRRLARLAGSNRIAQLTGAGLLGERAALNDYRIPGRVSAGGGCQLFDTAHGTIALNLARPDDRALLPALFESDTSGDDQFAWVAARMSCANGTDIVARGREMGLAIATVNEDRAGANPAIEVRGVSAVTPRTGAPRVLDLSALWAGPLAAHLLWLAGADVTRVENPGRPDAMRSGDSRFFALLNQGKGDCQLDPCNVDGRRGLLDLIAASDIVIESNRPRALLQLGIDADELVRAQPGLVWLSITGHGAGGEAVNWVGFGDDCGVAGGLTAALRRATGKTGFVGDAIADPLTGIQAACTALEAYRMGTGGRQILSMSGIVANALTQDRAALDADLKAWAKLSGAPFPGAPSRGVGDPAGTCSARRPGPAPC